MRQCSFVCLAFTGSMYTAKQYSCMHICTCSLSLSHTHTHTHTPDVSYVFLQEKFVRLSLAFKTDKMTLDKRVELHQRARDVAEQNIEQQMVGVKEALKVCLLIY